MQQWSVDSLAKAGLPSYLAFVNPNIAMMQTVHQGGLNYQNKFKM